MKNTALKLMAGYLLIILMMILCGSANAQSPCGDDGGLCVVQFNAGFNDANKVTWLNELTECETTFIDIMKDTKASSKYKIVVVPTILIFNDEEEVGRFQANIMMKMETTKKEVQSKIDEIIMDAF